MEAILSTIIGIITTILANDWTPWVAFILTGVLALKFHFNRTAISDMIKDLHQAAELYQKAKEPNSEAGVNVGPTEQDQIRLELNSALMNLFTAVGLPSLGNIIKPTNG